MISIFTPTHNSSFLPEVYKSLAAQTFKDWEWVVVYNNGAEEIDFGDARVKAITLPVAAEWVGPLKAHACEQATGEILLELDHDDLLTPDALEEVAKAFEDPEIGFAYSNTIHTDGALEKVKRFDDGFGWEYREVEFQGHKLDELVAFDPTPDSISRIWYAPNHLRAFRKSVYEEIGGYDKSMRVLDDQDIMCRMYLATKFCHIDKPLYVYRIHGENSWLRYNAEIQENVYRVYNKYITRLVARWADLNGLLKVELGGGVNAAEGFTTVDLKDADIIKDLNKHWPFKSGSVGVVRAIDVFEHLRDPLHTMKELYRVLAPGGYALIQVPSTDGRGAFQDPTHVSYWNENSFSYYTDGDFSCWIGDPVKFQTIRCFTTNKDDRQVCWVVAHLVKWNGQRLPGPLGFKREEKE